MLKFPKSIFKFMLQSKYDNDIVAEYWPTQETAKSTTSSLWTRAKTTPTTTVWVSYPYPNLGFMGMDMVMKPTKSWV